MTPHTRIMMLLLIAIALGFGAVPAVQAQGTADLALDKVLLQTGEPVFAGDQVIWNLTLTNNGPDDATGIQVTEDMSGLGIFTLDRVEAGEDTTYDNSVWSIPALASGAYTTLNLTTTVQGDGEMVNSAAVTAMDQEDPDPRNDQASASTGVGPSTTAEITVKPETLNLKSRGVFTVFIKFGEDYPLDAIDLEASSLVCNGAEPKRLKVTQKDGGMVVAKYRRQDLVDMAPGEEVTITCEGTFLIGEETVKVTGSDTIRVIGEKKKGLDAVLAGVLDTVLPLDDGTKEAAEDDGATTATPTPVKEQVRDRNQREKGNENGDLNRIRARTECSGECTECTGECPGCTGDCSASDAAGTQGNGKKAGTPDDDAVTGSQGNGNKAGTPDDDTVTGSQGNGNQADTGNGNGRGNSNPQDKEKGNGRGKN